MKKVYRCFTKSPHSIYDCSSLDFATRYGIKLITMTPIKDLYSYVEKAEKSKQHNQYDFVFDFIKEYLEDL